MEAIQLYRPLLPTIHEQPIHPHYQFNFIATPNHSKLGPQSFEYYPRQDRTLIYK